MEEKNELLEKIVKNSAKQLAYTRVSTLSMLVLTSSIIVCLVLLVPKVIVTIDGINDTITDISETITLADTTLESVTEMSTSISTMGTNMDTFITDNSETVTAVMTKLEEIDNLEWPEKIKTMQKNWIGKSYGANINFKCVDKNEEITVEEGTIFVMGDNRAIAMDSRLKEIGTIAEDRILGKVIISL